MRISDWSSDVCSSDLYEVAWFETVGAILPEAAPRLIAHDPDAGLFVMDYLDPAIFRNWKAALHAGEADPAVAREVARRLVRIHAATADDPVIAARFPNDAIFPSIRLEPYLEATGRAHPDLAPRLAALAPAPAGPQRARGHA